MRYINVHPKADG